MRITEDEVVTENNETLIYGIVHKEPSVLIIPWDGDKFILVGQYRYSVNDYSWEFPQGHMEHDSIKGAAIEELEEEAGVIAGELKKIGNFYLAPGHHTQKYFVFLATNLKEGKVKHKGAEVGMKIKRVSPDEMGKLISEGEIMDSPTITGFKIWELYNK